MSGLILPGQQQQQSQIGFQIVETGNNMYVLVIQSQPAQYTPMPPGPLEQIEAFCNTILQACQQSRAQKSLIQEVAQGNGQPVRMAE